MIVLSISADRMTELQRETLADATMQKLAKFIKEGWSGHERSVPSDVKPFFAFRDELVVENDVILKGQKAVVPKSLQSTYIAILQQGPHGCGPPKQHASDVVYWPKTRQDIESAVSQCSACSSCKAHLQKQPLINHPVPNLPWATVGADIFDWNNHQYLVMVDSYSGWFEMDLLPDSSSRAVISKMKRLFSTHGIPEKLLTDSSSAVNSSRLPRNGSLHTLQAAHTMHSETAWLKTLSSKQNSCWRNAEKMGLMFSWVS